MIFRYGLLVILIVSCFSCRKRLEELYYNPDQTREPAIEKFFTEMLDNNRIRPEYWEMRTFVVMQTGIYSQTVAYLNNSSVYQQNAAYTQDRWNDFYVPSIHGGGDMAHFRTIEAAFQDLPEIEKQKQRVFMEAARVILFDHAAQMIDLWGNIPFSDAGRLNTQGQIIFSTFDDARETYLYIIEQLKLSASYFATVKLEPATSLTLVKQDILLNGDLDKWHRYVNSLRLRLLMRISYYDESFARSEILSMLSNPATFPLIDGENIYSPPITDVLLQPLTTYTDNLNAAFFEANNFSAPQYMLDEAMKPANDPRIPVMFDKYGRFTNDQFIPNTEYNGLPANMNAEEQYINIGNYAILDSATFLMNNKLPGIVMTASEVNFIKAEAFERWGGGDAGSYYDKAIRQSINFYYYLNSLNTTTSTPLAPPSEITVTDFIQHPAIQYDQPREKNLEKIACQKWLHLGFLQSVQSWSEYRRTGFPGLTFRSSSLPGYELPPMRLVYPASETAYNPHYSVVKGTDIRTTPIFWDVK